MPELRAEERARMRRRRRRYQRGRCEECGHYKPVTLLVFWVNGFRMKCCADCAHGYRRVVLRAPWTGRP